MKLDINVGFRMKSKDVAVIDVVFRSLGDLTIKIINKGLFDEGEFEVVARKMAEAMVTGMMMAAQVMGLGLVDKNEGDDGA